MNKSSVRRYNQLNSEKKRSPKVVDYGETMTKQEFKEKSDINVIVERASRGLPLSTGMQSGQLPVFGDFTKGQDFHGAMCYIQDTERKFMSLPPKVRDRFDNDPAKLLDFLNEGKNRDEAIELGLVVKGNVPMGTPIAKEELEKKPAKEPENGLKKED